MFRKSLRTVKWKVPSALPLRQRRELWYLMSFGRRGDFENPKRFSEKVNWRILNDRSPELAWTCDKLAMKENVRALDPDIRIPRTLWSGTDLAEFAAMELPGRWVMKANHGSHQVHLGHGRPDLDALRLETADWLQPWHADVLGEWAYGLAEHTFITEEWIGGESSPTDYKIFVYRGVPRFIDVMYSRFQGLTERFYTAEWAPLDVYIDCPLAAIQPRPANLDRMLEHAATIGRDFDFLRVDLYDVDGEVWFGETTPYPGGGLDRWHPASFDHVLGAPWQLPSPCERELARVA